MAVKKISPEDFDAEPGAIIGNATGEPNRDGEENACRSIDYDAMTKEQLVELAKELRKENHYLHEELERWMDVSAFLFENTGEFFNLAHRQKKRKSRDELGLALDDFVKRHGGIQPKDLRSKLKSYFDTLCHEGKYQTLYAVYDEADNPENLLLNSSRDFAVLLLGPEGNEESHSFDDRIYQRIRLKFKNYKK